MLIKSYKAGNVAFLQDQVPALVGALIFWANLFVLAYLLRKGTFSQKWQPRCCTPAVGPPGLPDGLGEVAIGLVVRGQSEHGKVTPGQMALGRRHSLATPKPSMAAASTLAFHLYNVYYGPSL